MGLEGNSEKALINSLVAKIDEFNAKLNIPKTLKDFGINEEEFKEKVDKIAELAVGDACTGSNPRAIDPAAMAKLLTKIRAILLRDTGATISPISSFIFLQGLETLSLRVERHVENALKVVEYLNNHPQVERVHHPSVDPDPCLLYTSDAADEL